MSLLETITALSHEFGTESYVKGGGGNTSVKDAETLWVKPSGTMLCDIKAEQFVEMDRAKLAQLYEVETPTEKSAREALVKDMMAAAVKPTSSGRASVEAPLHNLFEATYVVHTHAELVNGMTCALGGKETCAKLFPEALWIDYIDPGYTLCMHVAEKMKDYAETHGKQPSTIILDNHGIFVAANTPEEIRAIYKEVSDILTAEYEKAGIPTKLSHGGSPSPLVLGEVQGVMEEAFGNDVAGFAYCGPFAVAEGPISPDHMVYAKSYFHIGEPTVESVKAFKEKYGYHPHIISTKQGVFAFAASEKSAELALLLAQDGGLLKQLAEAFGGIQYMTDEARDFIENWEVEAYRKSVAS